MGEKRVYRIVFQALITGGLLLYGLLFLLSLGMPSIDLFTNKLSAMVIALVVSYSGLIYFLVRMCSKNVRKWEVVLYNILNVVFAVIIVSVMKEMIEVVQEIFRNNNPYDQNVNPDEWYEYDEDCDYIPFVPLILYIFFGNGAKIATFVLSILSITFTFVKKSEPAPIEIKQDAINETNIENKEEVKNNKEERKVSYCIYCGKKTDPEAKFCKYCGNKIR